MTCEQFEAKAAAGGDESAFVKCACSLLHRSNEQILCLLRSIKRCPASNCRAWIERTGGDYHMICKLVRRFRLCLSSLTLL